MAASMADSRYGLDAQLAVGLLVPGRGGGGGGTSHRLLVY